MSCYYMLYYVDALDRLADKIMQFVLSYSILYLLC